MYEEVVKQTCSVLGQMGLADKAEYGSYECPYQLSNKFIKYKLF